MGLLSQPAQLCFWRKGEEKWNCSGLCFFPADILHSLARDVISEAPVARSRGDHSCSQMSLGLKDPGKTVEGWSPQRSKELKAPR